MSCSQTTDRAQYSAPETANVAAYGDPARQVRVDPPPHGRRATRDGRRGLVASSRAASVVLTHQCRLATIQRRAHVFNEYEQHADKR
jgi:hypothetical protein